MDDNVLANNDPDELPEDYFEKLEQKLLDEADESDHKDMPVSGKSVFEIERLKRKRAEENLEE